MRARLLKIGVPLVLLLALAGGGVAWATEGDDEMATGPEADRAKAAALAHLGGGRVTGVERESEDAAVWEVEVARADGPTVEVVLDASYRVLTVESEEDEDESGEDESDD